MWGAGLGLFHSSPLPRGPWTYPFLTQGLGLLKRRTVINNGTKYMNLFLEYNTESPELVTR